MKIIYNNIIPFKGFKAINLFGILFARKDVCEKYPMRKEDINHEEIHTAQMKEMLYVFFYIWYFIEWVLKLFKYGSYAYNNISFEREAYKNQNNLSFLSSRQKFNWFKYLKND